MGRVVEVITRTWQTADKMKKQFGPLPGEKKITLIFALAGISKYRLNPAISQGISSYVGSIEVGSLPIFASGIPHSSA